MSMTGPTTRRDVDGPVDHMRAQEHAVVACAQLAASLPGVEFDVDVRPYGTRWTVLVSWRGDLHRDVVRTVLDGPPAGVVLVHHARR